MDAPIIQEKPVMTISEKKELSDNLFYRLKDKNLGDKEAYAVSQYLFKEITTKEQAEELVKQFADVNVKSFQGTTSKDGNPKHNHDFVVMVLNWGSALVGVTTSITGSAPHIHTIKLNLDSKIMKIEAKTDLAMSTSSDEIEQDIHAHIFKSNIDDIRKNVPSIYVPSYSFDEREKPVKTTELNITNQRYAETLLLKAAQTENNEDEQAKVFNAVFVKYPELYIEDGSVEEMIINLAAKGKIDPKAKVRNRGDAICPAGSSNVTDNKDHFPQNSESQARNALARVSQYKSAPSWWKGSLASLQQKVRAAVKKKYPGIKVAKLNEFLVLRFRDNGKVFFKTLLTENVETAKYDAMLYFNDTHFEIDVIKFESTIEDGDSKFTELGTVVLYDRDVNKFPVLRDFGEVSLSEKDENGFLKIEILREGNYHHEVYGDFQVDSQKLNEIIKNFNGDVLAREIAFDMNHLPDLPAAAWVKKLNITKRPIKDQQRLVLNAHVEMTPRGMEALKNKEFKYFSAEYTDNFIDKETKKEYGTTLKGGGLTNRPWIPGMAPITLKEMSDKTAFITKE